MKRVLMVGTAVGLTSLMVAWVISCGGGGSGGGDDSEFSGITRTVNLGSWAPDVPISDSGTSSLVFSVNLGMGLPGGPYYDLELDIQENLSGLTFTPASSPISLSAAEPLGTETVTVTIYVDSVDAANACSTGIAYGPFEVTLDSSNQPESVDQRTAEATQSTLDIINIGAFSVCIEVQSTIDADVSPNEATFSACTEEIQDIAGPWEGTYYCTSSNPDCAIADTTVSLNITQADTGYANYTDDGGAFYMGDVCGYSFSFDGGGLGYTESGIFIMNPDGINATKTSYYEDTGEGTCTGACYDTLTRVVEPD